MRAASATSCCLRSAAKSSATCSRFPASARVVAETRRFVTPLIAETTTTTAPSRDASRTIWATRAMQAASPTEVPPNFMTRNDFFIFDKGRPETIGRGLEQDRIQLPGWPGYPQPLNQITIHHRKQVKG